MKIRPASDQTKRSTTLALAAIFVATFATCAGERNEGEAITAKQSAVTLDFGRCSKLRVATATGFLHSCALLSDGTVECWGANSSGQLGIGSISTTPALSPVSVVGIEGATAIAAGWYHTCVLITGGTVKCWGGALGNGATADSGVPVTVAGLGGATAIAAGLSTSCAVVTNGRARCWGDNFSGLRGDGTLGGTSTTPSVVTTEAGDLTGVAALAMGTDHVCARMTNGSVFCWGDNSRGQFGNITQTGSTRPITGSGSGVGQPQLPTGPGFTDVREIAAGSTHTCVLRNNGSVWCFGDNASGQLANGTAFSAVPVGIPGLTQIRGVFSSASSLSTCALLSTGTAACWGSNTYGQLGTGSSGAPLSPTSVALLTQLNSLAIAFTHTCAVDLNGALFCWGLNTMGEIGVGPTPDLAPVPMTVQGGGVSPADQVCRPAAGPCDVADVCSGSSPDCPDGFAGTSTTCRPSAGGCDPPETCSGTSAACPPNLLAAPGQVCRDAVGICDAPEMCAGGPDCPPDLFAIGGPPCRPSMGLCDDAEFCTGLATTCPADQVLPVGTVCRGPQAACDTAEVCNGTSPDCGPDLLVSAGTICSDSSDPCLSQEVCSGNSVTCPPSTQLPNCGGRVQGTAFWGGSPVSATVARMLVAHGRSTFHWFVPLDASGHYDSGIQRSGQYDLFIDGIACGERERSLAFASVSLVSNVVTTADFDLTSAASLVTGTIPGMDAQKRANIFFTVALGEDTCSAGVTTDDSGQFAVLLPSDHYYGTVTDASTGTVLATMEFTAVDGQHVVVVPTFKKPNGDDCSDGAECVSEWCIDGVCCENECGDSANDCLACSQRAGGTTNGSCELLPLGFTCYKGIASCETTEVCLGVDEFCPAATSLQPNQCTAVPPGTTVTAELLGWQDPPTPSPPGAVLVGFANATSGGNTSAIPTTSGAAPAPGYRVVGDPGSEHYWEIETSVSYTGDVTICIVFDPLWMLGPPEGILLEHWKNDAWEDITDSVVGNTVCGTTDSLSPFALMERLDHVGPPFSGVPGTITTYATSTAGAKVTYPTPTAVDAVDGPRPVTCAPASGKTFAPGKTTVTCTATDLSHNTTSASFVVWVQYQAPSDGSFFLKPIRANGTSVFRIGRPVPVKFQLTGASKNITNLTARLVVTKISNTPCGTFDDESDEDGDETDFLFKYRPGSRLYGYRWKTRGETAGTFLLRANLGDDVTHEVKVSLKVASARR